MGESTSGFKVARFGCQLAVSDELLAQHREYGEWLTLSLLPDDALTPEQLAARVEARRRNAEVAAAEDADRRALWAQMDELASSLGGAGAAAIRHHLPTPPAEGKTSYFDWPCPGCDGGPDEGGYFPCSTIDAVREATR